MSTVATAIVDTSRRAVFHRGFTIEEAYLDGGNVWQWTHADFDPVSFPVTGDCQTLFECIEAIDAWHASRSDALRTIREGEEAS